MEQSATILLIEDERQLAAALDYKLVRAGFRVLTAFSGKPGIELARRRPPPDLIVLDVMLPDITGFEVCEVLRSDVETRCIPVVFLSARGEDQDRIQGFLSGGDDYVVKPFSTDELLLRVRAVLRRGLSGGDPEARPTMEAGPLRIAVSEGRAFYHDRELSLTPLEFKLLLALVSCPGRVLSRERLLQDIWGIRGEVTERAVDRLVVRLRQKLGPDDPVRTVRGLGYQLELAECASPARDRTPSSMG